MPEVVYSSKVTDPIDHMSMAQLFQAFEEQYPQHASLTTEPKEISLESTCVPNWSCIWNKIPHMGMLAMPLAQKGQFTLVVMKDGQSEIYRNEDLDQIV